MFEIKLFLGLKKVSAHLLGLYKGELNKPYAFWFNNLLAKAENAAKRKAAKPVNEQSEFDKKLKRVREIINRSYKVENFKRPDEDKASVFSSKEKRENYMNGLKDILNKSKDGSHK